MGAVLGLLPWVIDKFAALVQGRRRLRVLVHKAVFLTPGSQVYYFVKVTNLSTKKEVEITHVWFATTPEVHLVNPHRSLPKRLRTDETWETWVEASNVPQTARTERLARVRLSTGTTVKSRLNRDVPPVGYVAGRNS